MSGTAIDIQHARTSKYDCRKPRGAEPSTLQFDPQVYATKMQSPQISNTPSLTNDLAPSHTSDPQPSVPPSTLIPLIILHLKPKQSFGGSPPTHSTPSKPHCVHIRPNQSYSRIATLLFIRSAHVEDFEPLMRDELPAMTSPHDTDRRVAVSYES